MLIKFAKKLSQKRTVVDGQLSKPAESEFSTVAILASNHHDVPLSSFSQELFRSLSHIGQTMHINSQKVKQVLGQAALDEDNDYSLTTWLSHQENHNRIVLYQCDTNFTPWTLKCLKQADCILILTLATSGPAIGEMERKLVEYSHLVKAIKELVILHGFNSDKPKNTAKWLSVRPWCSSHHHMRCPERIFKRQTQHSDATPISSSLLSCSSSSSQQQQQQAQQHDSTQLHSKQIEPDSSSSELKELSNETTTNSNNNNNDYDQANDNLETDYKSTKSRLARNNIDDFARLARRLTGTSIGLVLGGGGARGGAHIGMIKAILEAGIPIDMVGGVSIGAFMGALWCQENDIKVITQLARNWCLTMTSLWHQILDLTYPVTAMFTGAAFNRTIYDLFGDRQIEDLWLPYFNVTTDITCSGLRVHRHGSLWRYVRSSMSLSGYLPPLCDPVDGHLLLDGGYVNNLPADIMKEVMCAKTILAVDVGSQDDTDLANYGDHLSGWWLLWNRWNPFGTRVRIPGLSEIQTRLAYVCCVNKLEEVKAGKYCTYLRPPVTDYSAMDFGKIDEVIQVGYKHGKAAINSKRFNIHEISGLKSYSRK